MYYLETNSIRILSQKLHTPFYQNNCYTSILTICELLSGIKNDITFKQRKGIIRKIYFSKIIVDTDLPEIKRYKAFRIPVNSKTTEGIMFLAALSIACQSYSEFQEEIKKKRLAEYWVFLKIYDNVDGRFKGSFKKRQDIFDYSDPQMIADFKNRWDNLKNNPELKENVLNELIVYYAKTLMNNSFMNIGDKNLQDLINNYDHSIDIFFLCTGYFSGQKIIFKNAPGRNDYLDLAHLMYLRNPEDKINTNDQMLFQMMKKISPENILTTDNF